MGGYFVNFAQDWLCSPHIEGRVVWALQHNVESDPRDGVITAERGGIEELEREVEELHRTNEILRLAAAFFSDAEISRRLK